jgi:hypothetical protein
MEPVRNNMEPLVLVLLARYECSPLLMNHYGEVNTPNAFTEYSVDRVSVLSSAVAPFMLHGAHPFPLIK